MRISETERGRTISTKFLIHRVSAESTGDFLPKIVVPQLLAAILNFCVNAEMRLSRKRREIERFQ